MRTLHWFAKDSSFQTLRAAVSVLDYFYQPRSNQTGPTVLQKALGFSRAISFTSHKDLVVRVLSGF